MDVQSLIKTDLKRLMGSPFFGNLTRQFNDYEGRVRRLVKDFDLKSRQARIKSIERIEKINDQIQEARLKVEKKVKSVLQDEGERFNRRVRDLVRYLNTISTVENIAPPPAAKKAQATSRLGKSSRANLKKQASKTRGAKTRNGGLS